MDGALVQMNDSVDGRVSRRLVTASIVAAATLALSACATESSTSTQSKSAGTPAPTQEAASPTTATTSTSAPTFSISDEQSTGIEGVSTGVATVGSTTWLFPTTQTDRGVGAYRSSSNGSTASAGSTGLNRSSDATVVVSGTTLRMYYAVPASEPTPGASGPMDKRMRSATSTDGTNWTDEGLRISDVGWGVPDVTRYPDGTLRAWWVQQDGDDEKLLSATSRDGLKFTRDADAVLKGGWVDPAVILAEKNDFVMLVSDTPPRGERRPQQLYVATSTDGVSWSVDPTPIGQGFDPAGVKLSDGKWRIWWSAPPQTSGPTSQPPSPVVHTGILTRS